MNKLTALIPALTLALTLGAGTASAQDAGLMSIYSAKFVCGDSNLAPTGANTVLSPADYLTAINIFNPNTGPVTITKTIVFTELVSTRGNISGQEPHPPSELSAVQDNLVAFGAVEFDCAALAVQIPATDSGSDGPDWAKGFLIITSDADFSRLTAPLNVVGVYTSRGKEGDRSVTLSVVEYTGRFVRDKDNALASGQTDDGSKVRLVIEGRRRLLQE
jgi:hypothetical protein